MRIFKIGTTEIVENETLLHLTNDEVKQRLERAYPEIKNATAKETPRENDTLVEWIPVAGKKG